MRMLMPSHAKNVKPFRDTLPIFTRFAIENQLDAMFQPVVQLRSGGYIVINQTEALVAIDVNSGRATREHHIEDTALKTNLEAADEIARQLRLRDLAGLVVIDFIDMDEKRNNRTVERRLKEALKQDRARIQVGHISHFGLLEMSRQRIRSSVLESSTDKCPQCGGTGHVRSVSSVSLQLLRSIEEMLLKGATHNIIVRTRTEIALYLLNHKRAHLRTLEERFRITITVNADATISGQTSYVIEKGELVHSLEQAKAIAAQPIAAVPITDDDEDDFVEDERPSKKRSTSKPKPPKRATIETISRKRRAATATAKRGADAAGGAGGADAAAAVAAKPAKAASARCRRRSTAAAQADDEGAWRPTAKAPAKQVPTQDGGPGERNGDGRRRRRGRRGGRRNRRGRNGDEPRMPSDSAAAVRRRARRRSTSTTTRAPANGTPYERHETERHETSKPRRRMTSARRSRRPSNRRLRHRRPLPRSPREPEPRRPESTHRGGARPCASARRSPPAATPKRAPPVRRSRWNCRSRWSPKPRTAKRPTSRAVPAGGASASSLASNTGRRMVRGGSTP